MKKTISLIAAALMLNVSIAVVPFSDVVKPLNANDVMILVGKTGQKISLAQFSKLKPGEYEKIANVKLGFFERIAYKKAMKKLNKGIAEDGTITNKKIAKSAKKTIDGGEPFNLGGFALGLLLSIIGVLIAYLINDDSKSARIRWAWIGFGISLVIYLVILIL
jgi:hypothetical protein